MILQLQGYQCNGIYRILLFLNMVIKHIHFFEYNIYVHLCVSIWRIHEITIINIIKSTSSSRKGWKIVDPCKFPPTSCEHHHTHWLHFHKKSNHAKNSNITTLLLIMITMNILRGYHNHLKLTKISTGKFIFSRKFN